MYLYIYVTLLLILRQFFITLNLTIPQRHDTINVYFPHRYKIITGKSKITVLLILLQSHM